MTKVLAAEAEADCACITLVSLCLSSVTEYLLHCWLGTKGGLGTLRILDARREDSEARLANQHISLKQISYQSINTSREIAVEEGFRPFCSYWSKKAFAAQLQMLAIAHWIESFIAILNCRSEWLYLLH